MYIKIFFFNQKLQLNFYFMHIRFMKNYIVFLNQNCFVKIYFLYGPYFANQLKKLIKEEIKKK